MTLEIVGFALLVAGLALSVSTFPLAIKAARGQGRAKLRPLTLAYWIGLFLIAVGGALQTISPPLIARKAPLEFHPALNSRDDSMYVPAKPPE